MANNVLGCDCHLRRMQGMGNVLHGAGANQSSLAALWAISSKPRDWASFSREVTHILLRRDRSL